MSKVLNSSWSLATIFNFSGHIGIKKHLYQKLILISYKYKTFWQIVLLSAKNAIVVLCHPTTSKYTTLTPWKMNVRKGSETAFS